MHDETCCATQERASGGPAWERAGLLACASALAARPSLAYMREKVGQQPGLVSGGPDLDQVGVVEGAPWPYIGLGWAEIGPTKMGLIGPGP